MPGQKNHKNQECNFVSYQDSNWVRCLCSKQCIAMGHIQSLLFTLEKFCIFRVVLIHLNFWVTDNNTDFSNYLHIILISKLGTGRNFLFVKKFLSFVILYNIEVGDY